jgi:hypothetical protein
VALGLGRELGIKVVLTPDGRKEGDAQSEFVGGYIRLWVPD